MRFNPTIVREENLETNGYQESPHPQFEDVDLPPISTGDTSFLLDCGSYLDDPFHNCDCQFTEMVTDSACNSTQILKLCKKPNKLFLKSLILGKYVTPSATGICLEDTMSAKISIYSYIVMPLKKQLGIPVLLNFTDNFCACTKQGETVVLTLESYDISKLQLISADDSEKYSHVFFMSQSADGLCRFESAFHSGWFIQTMDSGDVNMQKENLPGYLRPNTFFSLIKSEC